MQKSYENRYLDAVKELTKSGMEMHLLSGRAVRQRLKSSETCAMTAEFELKVQQLCPFSLVVGADSADQLAKHRGGHEQVGAPFVKTVHQT